MPLGSVWAEILEINQDYLGPAAERFLDRQIATHLGKKSQQITKGDLLKLIDWLRLSFALLTNDSKLVNDYTLRLQLVARGRGKEALSQKWSPK